jgi:flagellar secretion chaperone FliS
MVRDAKSTYRRGAVEGASPVRLVILLYEQLTEDLRRATAATEQHDTETRTHHLGHAHEVLGLLQGCLDMNAGLEVAENLGRFYGMLRDGLLRAQFHPDGRVLEKYIAQLLSLREAWIEVERNSSGAPRVAHQAGTQRSQDNDDDRRLQGDWRA